MPFAPFHVLEQILTSTDHDDGSTVTTVDSSQASGGTSNGADAYAPFEEHVANGEISEVQATVISPTPPIRRSESLSLASDGRVEDEANGALRDGTVICTHGPNPDSEGSVDGSTLTQHSAGSVETESNAHSRQRWRLSWPLSGVSSAEENDGSQNESSSALSYNSSLDPDSDVSPLSFRPSMVGSSVALTDSSTESDPECASTSSTSNGGDVHIQSLSNDPQQHPPLQHDPDSFINVGNSLLQSSIIGNNGMSLPSGHSVSCTTQIQHGEHWWSTYSEQDWDEMAEAARSVLDSLEDSYGGRDRRLLLVPPCPPMPMPMPETNAVGHTLEDKAQASVLSLLPPEFVCPLCKDVIVGAAVLDCGCPLSTFCIQCIEREHSLASQPPSTRLVEDDYVFVERNYGEGCMKPSNGGCDKSNDEDNCPSCTKAARMVPCHALNVAIVNSIMNLSVIRQPGRQETSPIEKDICTFQCLFYGRLSQWRDEVLRRRDLQLVESNVKREEALAMLIQAEEDIVWNKKKRRRFWRSNHRDVTFERRRGMVIFGEMTLLLAAAAAAAMLGRRG